MAGVKFRPLDVIERAETGHPVTLVPEPTNEYDSQAIKVLGNNGDFLGYVPKKHTWILHTLRKAGIPLHTEMVVNHALRPEEEILCRVVFVGQEEAELINS